ncbi:hypothetical protein FPV67DRAFT_1479846 [Lyophyllum atratum]|nr:hypothetical protein FPV67DRAFT_1479846 [Lyophyllum atratum]
MRCRCPMPLSSTANRCDSLCRLRSTPTEPMAGHRNAGSSANTRSLAKNLIIPGATRLYGSNAAASWYHGLPLASLGSASCRELVRTTSLSCLALGITVIDIHNQIYIKELVWSSRIYLTDPRWVHPFLGSSTAPMTSNGPSSPSVTLELLTGTSSTPIGPLLQFMISIPACSTHQ